MANFGDLIGAFMQSAMSNSGQQRMGNAVEDLLRGGMASMGGGQGPGPGRAPAGAQTGAMASGGIGDLLGQLLGSAQGGGAQGPAGGAPQGGGLGDLLGQLLGAAQSGLGSAAQNPGQAGGIGAVLGGLLGGGSGSVKGALGGGALALLASIAFKALQGAGQGAGQGALAAPGLMASPAGQQDLEATAQVVLKGMISAAKADGQIDADEMQRIVGKLQEHGMDEETKAWVLNEMRRPLDLDALVAEIPNAEVAAQVYAASLLAIKVDTDTERRYLAMLADKSRLHPMVVQRIQQSMGIAA